jgi:hypothetical protein
LIWLFIYSIKEKEKTKFKYYKNQSYKSLIGKGNVLDIKKAPQNVRLSAI